MTIAIARNAALANDETCFGESSGCAAWQASQNELISRIRLALDNDPGQECLGLLSCYNPFRWDGSSISISLRPATRTYGRPGDRAAPETRPPRT